MITYQRRKNTHNFTETFIVWGNILENLLHNGNLKVPGLTFRKPD